MKTHYDVQTSVNYLPSPRYFAVEITDLGRTVVGPPQGFLSGGDALAWITDNLLGGPFSVAKAHDLAPEVADYLATSGIPATAVGRNVYIRIPKYVDPVRHADIVVDVVEAALTIIRRRDGMSR